MPPAGGHDLRTTDDQPNRRPADCPARRAALSVGGWLLCLLPSLAAGPLWVRSHFVRDCITFRSSGERHGRWHGTAVDLFSSGGGTGLRFVSLVGTGETHESVKQPYRRRWEWTSANGNIVYPFRRSPDMTRWEVLRFTYVSSRSKYRGEATDCRPNWTYSTKHHAFVVPYWFMTASLAAWPASRLCRRVRSLRRPRPGHCPACGYDLRATPGRCPECGRPAAAPAPPDSLAKSEPERPAQAD